MEARWPYGVKGWLVNRNRPGRAWLLHAECGIMPRRFHPGT